MSKVFSNHRLLFTTLWRRIFFTSKLRPLRCPVTLYILVMVTLYLSASNQMTIYFWIEQEHYQILSSLFRGLFHVFQKYSQGMTQQKKSDGLCHRIYDTYIPCFLISRFYYRTMKAVLDSRTLSTLYFSFRLLINNF